jgi:MFS family permease
LLDKTATAPTAADVDTDAAAPALDRLNLFVANIQTGFGPFIAIYLATQGWTQTAIGFAFSLGTLAAMASQMPAGALVDAMHNKGYAAAAGLTVFTLSALLFAVAPVPLFVYIAEILHSFASCMLGPAVAAISLAVAGRRALGARLGRNARYASIGSALGAGLMGACGYYLSDRSIFFLTAILTLPALALMAPLLRLPGAAERAAKERRTSASARLTHLLADRRLLVFACCAALFTLGNAATLPLISTALNKGVGDLASLLIAACIVLPQVIVALISPTVGRLAEARGRRLVLVLGLAALPLRCVVFSLLLGDPGFVVLAQALDGIAAACFGVLVPLVTSDIAGESGHFNLALGYVGFFIGIGGTFSTVLGGWAADRFGDPAAFLSLGAVGVAAVVLAAIAMPETRAED